MGQTDRPTRAAQITQPTGHSTTASSRHEATTQTSRESSPRLASSPPIGSDGSAALAGGDAAAGHHRWHALHHGQRPVLHPQGRPWPPEARRERHVGCRHGAPRQEAPRGTLLRKLE